MPSASGMPLRPHRERDQDVVDATGLHVIEDLHPEPRILGALDPQP